MIKRLGEWLLTMLLCFDQFMQCWLRGWYYVWIGGDRPSADMTISAWCGASTKWWGPYARAVIDFFFGADHCARAVKSDDAD